MSEATSIHVQRAVAGDRESLGWIVAHFDPFLIAQVRIRMGSTVSHGDEIRDVVDEIWLALLGKVGDLRPHEGRLTPVLLRFLSTATFNVCNNHLRRFISEKRRHYRSGEPPRQEVTHSTISVAALAARQRSVSGQASLQEIGAQIGSALDTLEPDKVEVLVLRLLEQLSNVEIASLLGIPRNTVAVRYRRALEKLRETVPPSVFSDILALRRS